jgi:cytoskeletal protein CcmA (bactofilin family)
MRKKVRFIRWGAVLMVLVASLLVLAAPVSATEIRDADTVTIPAGEVIDDDLVVFGRRIVIDGTVEGDLMASSGEEMIINGRVGGSVAALGTDLIINGQVDGSVWGAGMAVTLGEGAEVNRNVYVAAASVTAEPGSTVGRDVYAGAYQVILNGDVAQDVTVGSAALEVDGTIGGNLYGEVQVPEGNTMLPASLVDVNQIEFIDPGMRISEGAVAGDMKISETIVAPTTEQQPVFAPFAASGFLWILSQRVGEFIALLVVGALIIRFWPAFLSRTTQVLHRQPGESVGWGFLWTLVFPLIFLAALFVLISFAILGGVVTFGYLGRAFTYLGSATISMMVALFGLAFFMLSKIVVTYLVGKMLVGRNRPEDVSLWLHFGYLVLGVFLYEVLRAIPILGAVVALVVILFGMGAMFLAWRERRAEVAPVVEEKPVLATE